MVVLTGGFSNRITMKEWSKKSEFNSFNSWKGLLYADWYKAIIQGKFLPPIEASLDPIHACNLRCDWCNFGRYFNKDMRMTDEHLVNLIEFLAKWKVKAICFGGGGEPTLHTKLPDAIELTARIWNMECSVATNGTLFTDWLIDSMARYCRWVGVSVDAATESTYVKGRKDNLFNQVLKNIEKLAREISKIKESNCDVAYKFLIFDHNQYEIYEACKIAKETGCRDFHARPADPLHQGIEAKETNWSYDIAKVLEQFEKCHKLETDNFRVFTVVHKFDETFKPRRDFTQCYGAPLCIQLCADGKAYFCVDQRHQKEYLLGTHYPDPANILNFWGNQKHKELVFGNTPKRCKTRCTFGRYCKTCEEQFTGKDPMCWRFV